MKTALWNSIAQLSSEPANTLGTLFTLAFAALLVCIRLARRAFHRALTARS